MTFLVPVGFALAALAGPILLLYMLRSRRARRRVPSTLLWRLETQNVSSSAPWQPLRFSWLLFLQLLALLLLVIAVARPARVTATPLAAHTVVIIDTSASMQAEDDGRSRLVRAKQQAIDTVHQLGPGQRMSVVDAGPSPRVVIASSSDRAALAAAIDAIRATDGASDAARAFALASSLETAAVPTIIHFYSDGAIRDEDRARAPANLLHVPVGTLRGNVALANVAAVPTVTGWDITGLVRNTATTPAQTTVVVYAGDRALVRRSLDLGPASTRDLSIPLPRVDADRIRISLEPLPDVADALRADNHAFAMLSTAPTLRVLLVGEENVFIRALVASIPGAELTVSEDIVDARGYTLAIYDGVALPRDIAAPAIAIAPRAGARGVRVLGERRNPVITYVQPRDPVLADVDLSRVSIRRAQQVRAPDMRAVVRAGEDPLLLLGTLGPRRLAYLAFDPQQSSLPVQVAYPVLFSNLVAWLTQGERAGHGARIAGDPLPLLLPGGTDRVVITTPDGREVERAGQPARFDETSLAGVYRVRAYGGGRALADTSHALNVSPGESALGVRRIEAPAEATGSGRGRLAGVRAMGPGILAAGLLVLLGEWWLAYGRPGARRFPMRRLRLRRGGAA